MKITINSSEFVDAFRKAGRGEQFSYNGLQALFDHLEEMEAGSGEEMELDVIAICCDYSEHATALEAATEYGFEADSDEDEEANEKAALEYLCDNTTVLSFDGGVIILNY